jgi:glycerol-3-phosphate dehydrogenase (NAD(P)+)
MRIAVLGAGAWGTALAVALAKTAFAQTPKHQVTLWARDASLLNELQQTRRNDRYLRDVVLPAALTIEVDFSHALADAELALVATSTSGLASTVTAIHQTNASLPTLWACKGFDRSTGKLPHETVAEIVGNNAVYGVLSGPSFALEVATGLPAALTVACNQFSAAQTLANTLNGGNLRVYSNADLIGVELGGALKNVMAIAAGLCDGMQLGMNARAALITRGLAEMMRLGVAMGGKAETFTGLTGLGDLILTATGSLSRNRSVGMALSGGKKLDEVLRELGHVAEGVNSAETALKLAKKFHVEMPITEAVCAVLFAGADPRKTVKQLLARETKAE